MLLKKIAFEAEKAQEFTNSRQKQGNIGFVFERLGHIMPWPWPYFYYLHDILIFLYICILNTILNSSLSLLQKKHAYPILLICIYILCSCNALLEEEKLLWSSIAEAWEASIMYWQSGNNGSMLCIYNNSCFEPLILCFLEGKNSTSVSAATK